MPRKKKLRDLNALAAAIVSEATAGPAEQTLPEDPPKNPHAQALSKLGASKGGQARAKKLTAEERRKIARRAAKARWRKKGSKPA